MNDFEIIYKEYYNRLYWFLLKITDGDIEISEELTQETFFQIYLSLHTYKGNSELFTWICAVAKNTYYKYLRKNRKQKQFNVDFDVNIISDTLSIENLVINNILIKKIEKSINNLPILYKNVVVLRAYYNFSYKEIANQLNISESSAKVIFHRVRLKFKEEYEYEK